MSESLFATCSGDLSDLLADEVRSLGGADVRIAPGGVRFTGTLTTAYRVCLWSRVASRVLLRIAEFPATDTDALYEGAAEVRWTDHLGPGDTLRVDLTARRSPITHDRFAAQRIKDAIVDRFRATVGDRPDVDLADPTVRVRAHLERARATLFIDLAGHGLHQRGYRPADAAAPLRETVAAGMLLRAGWPGLAADGAPLLDPMCGAATLAIEGAMIADDIAPGLARDRIGFERWRGHDAGAWAALRTEAGERARSGAVPRAEIRASDAEPGAVDSARRAIAAAGLADRIGLARSRLEDLAPPGPRPGLVAVNPPYGERLGDREQALALHATLGEVLTARFAGWRAAILCADDDLAARIGLRGAKFGPLRNGPIDTRLLRCDIGRRDATPPAPGKPAPGATAAAAGPGEAAPAAPVPAPADKPAPLGAAGEMLANRLRKRLRVLRKWARRHAVDCYRLYDADLPEFNVAIDIYLASDLHAHVQEYAPPATIDGAVARARIATVAAVLAEVLELPPERIHLKQRRRQRGDTQYERLGEHGALHAVAENGYRVLVNFTDYLDTGLFLDHRPTRAWLRDHAAGKRFLNLFAYTATATVAAVAGGAVASDSVDLSPTYARWAARNLRLNGCDETRHRYHTGDCGDWLRDAVSHRHPRPYDLIFVDPPTFSNSKRTGRTFDVERDHAALLAAVMPLLAADGTLVFSTNKRRFALDTAALPAMAVDDVSRASVPEDFARRAPHRCWHLRHR